MSDPINSHGLTPLKFWKLHEIDGFQLLVSLQEHDEDENRDQVVFETGVEELGSTMQMAISGPPKAMRLAFDMAAKDEAGARCALQKLFDQVHALLPSLGKVEA